MTNLNKTTRIRTIDILKMLYVHKVLDKISNNTASFEEHPVYSISKMYSVLILIALFSFATDHPKCICKSNFFLKFQVEGSSVIASLVEHPVCSNLEMYSVLILDFCFNLSLLMQSPCVKIIFSWSFRCSAKEAVILLISLNALY